MFTYYVKKYKIWKKHKIHKKPKHKIKYKLSYLWHFIYLTLISAYPDYTLEFVAVPDNSCKFR